MEVNTALVHGGPALVQIVLNTACGGSLPPDPPPRRPITARWSSSRSFAELRRTAQHMQAGGRGACTMLSLSSLWPPPSSTRATSLTVEAPTAKWPPPWRSLSLMPESSSS